MSYEKTLKQSMVDKKIDEKESQELKKIYNHYIDKRKELLKNTSSKAGDIFGDVISKDNFSQEQITILNTFLSQNNVNINTNIKFKFFNLKRKTILSINRVFLLNMIFSQKMTKTWCVGGRHHSNTNSINQYEKKSHKIKKVVKIIKGTCSNCGRIKNQIFSK